MTQPLHIGSSKPRADNSAMPSAEKLALARQLLANGLENEKNFSSTESLIKPFPEEMVTDSRKWSRQQHEKHFEHGLKLIAEGKVAIVTLAGGQGTRLGSVLPKGCCDIGLPYTLFDLQYGRIQRLEALARKKFPAASVAGPMLRWAIMTSSATHEETVKYFKMSFPSLPLFFQQGSLPCFSAEPPYVELFKDGTNELVESPDGNGGVFVALKSSKILERWRKEGILHVHIYCVDNILTRVADPCFISVCAQEHTPCGIKVVEKTNPSEKVGILALGNKYASSLGVQMMEYSELSSELTLQKNGSALLYRLANIASHYFSLDFLEMAATRLECCSTHSQILPAHIAKKQIQIGGKSVPGFKLERFIFDIFNILPSPKELSVMLVSRTEEFSPLKNASVPGQVAEGTPESCREALLAQYQKLLNLTEAEPVNIRPEQWYLGEPINIAELKMLKK